MIPAAEIAAAQAVPIVGVVERVLGPLKRDFALCPFHSEKTPSLHIERKRNIWVCFGCGARGDTIEFVQRAYSLAFLDAVRQLLGGVEVSSLPPVTKRAPQPPEVPSLVSDLWRTATAPRLASMYLETRGIPQKTLPPALRGHQRVWCKEAGEYRPAMIAAVTDGAGRLTAVQRTYLEDRLVYDGQTDFAKGARAADLENPKLSLGPMGNGAVKLAAAGEVLGLAEGCESALAAAKLFRLPVWAVCGDQRLGNVQLPECVRHIVIFGDNDPNGVGQAAAAKAERIYRQRGYSTQSEFPETDWCEAVR